MAWAAVGLALAQSGCGSSPPPSPAARHPVRHPPSGPPPPPPVRTAPAAAPRPTALPRRRASQIVILPAAKRRGRLPWTPLAEVGGQVAAWIRRVSAHGEPGQTVTLVRFDQRVVRLALHAGTEDPGGRGWRYGAAIGASERHMAVAAFNSAFRPAYGAGGFMMDGRIGWRLRRGAASVVIYRDGTADIGLWHRGLPTAGQQVAAVRQNLRLLVDHGRAPSTVDTCIKACWGDPLHEQPLVARSGLGITASGQLVWVAGERLSVRALADALIGAGVERAMELDINPAWVAAYAYAHPRHGGGLAPIGLLPRQAAIPGQFLAPYYRDFFTVLARNSP